MCAVIGRPILGIQVLETMRASKPAHGERHTPRPSDRLVAGARCPNRSIVRDLVCEPQAAPCCSNPVNSFVNSGIRAEGTKPSCLGTQAGSISNCDWKRLFSFRFATTRTESLQPLLSDIVVTFWEG